MLRAGQGDTGAGGDATGSWQGVALSAVPGDLPGRILTLVSIAAAHGSSLSLEELGVLMPDAADAGTLEDILTREGRLREALAVVAGEIVPRGLESLADASARQRELARRRVQEAAEFAARLARACPWIRLVGVSGSAAYGKARPQDDIDFFVVTGKRRLWVTLLTAMLLGRIARLRATEAPVYCFNRSLEEDRCEAAFRDRREPLFAREALNLRVLLGGTYYATLLREAAWMEGYFPNLYRMRGAAESADASVRPRRGGVGWTALNAVALLLVGPYLWMAGQTRNRMHVRKGNRPAQFRTVVRRGFCAYESEKYDDLRDAYLRAF